MQKEKRLIANINVKILVEKPIETKDIVNKTNEIYKGILLSNFETSHPEIGSPINELIGIAKSMLPSSASFK